VIVKLDNMVENYSVMKTGINHNNHESSIQGVTGDRKGERLLELSLPALVIGQKATGKSFQENTELVSISSEQARFLLKSPVKIGTLLKLSLKVPATPFLIYPLKLQISGRVSRVEINGHKKFIQRVTIRLERKFELQPVSSSPDN
jgi:hypothetical protein